MIYRLLCIDLDGTLLTDDKDVGTQDIEAIRKASTLGIRVALVTGRMPAATDPIVGRLGIPCIMACNAGTYILKEDRCISSEYLSVETMMEIHEKIKALGIPLWIFRDRQWYVTAKDRFVKAEEKIISHESTEVLVDVLADTWRQEQTGPNKLLVAAEPEMLQKVYGMLKNCCDTDMACSTENYLEIFPKGMDKGKALCIICAKEGISREETIAFGDQELDIPMLEAAGVAVAMGNAIEKLKRNADYITGTNNESGIAQALEYFLSR